MPITDYASLADVKDWLKETRATSDSQFTIALDAAHKWVDRFCGRQFTADGAATVRQVRSYAPFRCSVPDISTLTGLIVAVDTDGNLTWETVWIVDDDYKAFQVPNEPGFPYTIIQATASRQFPEGPRRVQVTADWGWPAVPEDVKQATILQAAYLYERRKAPHGVVGTAETGFLEFKGRGDPDAKFLLRDLRRRY